jgi:hypothetical protein
MPRPLGVVRVKLELPDPDNKPGEVTWRYADLPGVPHRGDFIQWEKQDLVVQDVLWTPQDPQIDLLVVCVP